LDACTKAVEYLSKQPPQALQRISFGLLGKAAGVQSSLSAVPVAEYLSSGRLHLLDKQYVLIVDDEEFEISLEEVHQAKIESILYHPDKGEAIKDFADHLFLFFVPSPAGLEVFCGPQE
jgi:hypothetical protein